MGEGISGVVGPGLLLKGGLSVVSVGLVIGRSSSASLGTDIERNETLPCGDLLFFSSSAEIRDVRIIEEVVKEGKDTHCILCAATREKSSAREQLRGVRGGMPAQYLWTSRSRS